MPAAVRIGDQSNHGGVYSGPGVPTVSVVGMVAAVVVDLHTCPLPPSGHQPTTCPAAITGSTTVTIGGKPALRMGDSCACGASPVPAQATVSIG